jgi:uncharacterized protein YciI
MRRLKGGRTLFFVATCFDKPNHLRIRLDRRPKHLAYLNSLGAKLKIAGALLGPDNETPIGSMLIYDVADENEARRLVNEDPFAKVGLFDTVEVRAWRQAVGAPLS